MADEKQLELVSLHFAIFFRDVVSRPDREFADLNEKMQNLFDGIPTILGIPEGAPPEIPIVNLKSEQAGYTCSIARSRADLTLSRNDERPNQDLLVDFNRKTMPFVEYLLSKREVVRFGMVSRYFYTDADSIKTIKNKYFNDSIGSVCELSIRFNQQSEFEGFVINDIVDVGAQIAIVRGQESKGILVSRDINNTQVPEKIIALSQLVNISKEFSSRLSEKNIQDLIK